MTPLDLSYDHRALNGADAAKFTKKLTQLIQKPERIMV
ncbi:2-oxo acid dehydrogenase subunit E2 [Roseisalinus antarcticus]|nr:2-oxo acid dehydrogenase subunit E2 [Roseisalinus antarcticus]